VSLPWQPTRQALAVLRHPDRRTAWVIVLIARLTQPELADAERLRERIAALHAAVPMMGARLLSELWHPASPPDPILVDGDPLAVQQLSARFDLASEPPVRIVVADEGDRVGVAVHHAAFDGLGALAVLDALLAGPLPAAPRAPAPGPIAASRGAIERLAFPADRVAPSGPRPVADSFAASRVRLDGQGVTGRIAAAAIAAVGARNHALAKPWRRVGISVAVGGPPGAGNVASYRRVDLRPSGDLAEEVTAALRSRGEPGELVRSARIARLLSPLAPRLSDSLLVSNLGRHAIGGVRRLDFYPVARGRSAVAVGACGVQQAETSLTLRARDLSPADCEALLEDLVARLG
jgi:hypothetical protein